MTRRRALVALCCVLGLSIALSLAASSCSHGVVKPVGGLYDPVTMKSLVPPPEEMPAYLRAMIYVADKKAGKEMLPGRVLAWSPDIGIGSGLLELYVEDGAADILDKRLIKLLRLVVSYAVPSPFALDINAWNYGDFDITKEEIDALQGAVDMAEVASFSDKEKVALTYARAISQTPMRLTHGLLNDLRRILSEKEIVAVASLAAKVNYWARLVEALRIKPAGYTNDPALRLEAYSSFRERAAGKTKAGKTKGTGGDSSRSRGAASGPWPGAAPRPPGPSAD